MNISKLVVTILDELYLAARRYNMSRYSFRHIKNKYNKKILTIEQKKAINNFYLSYGKVCTEFHSFYTDKTGLFSEKYIPDYIYFNKVNTHFNDNKVAKIIDNKCYYDIIFQGFKQPVKLADRKGGCWFIGNQMMTLEQVLDKLCEEHAVFIKASTASSGGGGVKFIDKKSCDNYKQQIKEVIERIGVDLVVQKPIVQHKDLSKLNESSVNTMRLLSVFRNGEVKIYSSLLRIGKANSKVDNGSISVGITSDGKLKEYGYYLTGERVTRHPGSGVVLKDYQLPSFDKAQELVKKAHLCVPHFKMVSWDIAIGEDSEPILIEANLSDGEVSFHQLNNGPLFGDDTREILNEVFGK